MERNPNHPVTREVHNHWHKIAAMLLQKLGGKAEITIEEIERLQGQNIVLKPDDRLLRVWLVGDEEGKKLAEREGGLPSQS